jgi:hypothetical protein
MGFMDEVSNGGGAPLLKFNKEARYVRRGSDEALNDQEFIADVRGAKGGYLKFGEKDQAPERHMGSIFPKDEAPLRSTLGNLDQDEWPASKFNRGEVEDPWTAVIEIPLRHRETGEELLFVAQSKTSLGAARDLLSQARRVPDGYDPIIRLGVGSFKSKFGLIMKPVLSIVGKVPSNGAPAAREEPPFNDSLGF